jgi:hypothetical protein
MIAALSCGENRERAGGIPMSKIKLALSTAAAALLLAVGAQAATPMTADGKPDLTGAWSNASLTPLARPRTLSKLELTPEEAKAYMAQNAMGGANDKVWQKAKSSDPNAPAPTKGGDDFGTKAYDTAWTSPGEDMAKVGGRYRSSNIVEPANGQLPYRDPAAAARRAQERGTKYALGNDPYVGPESTTLSERCLIGFGGTGGPGMLSVLYNNNYQFVLTKDYLGIDVEMAHDARLIPIFASAGKARASHRPDAIKPWLGDSVAWWEGPSLVIETINVRPLQGENHPFYLSPKAKVTERLTRKSETEILYQFAVDDPETYTQPWKAELAFYPGKGVFEYACHEGNYGLEGILAGARAREAEARSQASAGR